MKEKAIMNPSAQADATVIGPKCILSEGAVHLRLKGVYRFRGDSIPLSSGVRPNQTLSSHMANGHCLEVNRPSVFKIFLDDYS